MHFQYQMRKTAPVLPKHIMCVFSKDLHVSRVMQIFAWHPVTLWYRDIHHALLDRGVAICKAEQGSHVYVTVIMKAEDATRMRGEVV